MNIKSFLAFAFLMAVLLSLGGCSEESWAIWQISHSRNPQKRIEAVRKLGKIGDEEALRVLVEALDDKDIRVSITAMEELSDLEVKAIDDLLGALVHQSTEVRRRAIQALGRMYGDEFELIYEHKMFDLLSGKEKYVDQVGTAVIKKLADTDSCVREDARNLLFNWSWWWKPDSTAVEPLIDAYAFTDSIAWLRGQAMIVELMSKINDRRLVPTLIDALNSRVFAVGSPATYGLKNIKGNEAVQALSAILEDTSFPYSYQVTEALGYIGDSASVDALIDALNNGDELIREFAAGALDHVNDPRAVEALIWALEDDSERVRGIAALSLGYGYGRDEKVFDALVRSLRDEAPFVRGCATQALGKLGGPRALNLLTQALADPDPDARSGAIIGLAKLKDHRAVKPLERVLREDEYSVIRHAAASALGKITGKHYKVSEEGAKHFPGVCSH